jgi:hypothetical protein
MLTMLDAFPPRWSETSTVAVCIPIGTLSKSQLAASSVPAIEPAVAEYLYVSLSLSGSFALT